MGLQKLILSKLAAALVILAGVGCADSALAGCSYELTPVDRTHGFGAITAKVSVATSSSGCNWTVVNNNSWITIIAGASGTGDADVTYAVAGNPNPGTRIGIIRIAGRDFTVTQTGVTCTYSISPPNHDKCYGATTGSVQVSTQSPCPWTVVNPNDWILITDGNSGTGSDKVFYSVLANAGTTSRTGNVLIAGQVFTINQAPYPVICAANKQVECGALWNFDAPTLNAPDVTLQTMTTVTNFLCGKSFTAIRTWTTTNHCGNVATCSQTVTAVDVTPPVPTRPADKSVECGAAWSFDPPTAEDSCDGANVSIIEVGTVTNLGCGQTFTATRTWRATDACGNFTESRQTVMVVDTTKPSIICVGNKTVECTDSWSFDAPAASDTCGSATLSIVNTVTNTTGHCGNTFDATRTWRATDACGNFAECSQSVTVVDVTPPVLTCSADKSVECGTAWSFDRPTANDGCDGVNVTIVVVNTVTNLGCGQSFIATWTWRATDACGNAATCSQTVQVTNPLVVVCPPNRMVPCNVAWTFDTPGLPSGCGFSITVSSTATNFLCGATYNATRIWMITDGCVTHTCTQTVDVIDQTPPTIVCLPDITVTNFTEVPHCPKTLTEFLMGGGATSDNCGAVRYRCVDAPLIENPCGGVIERTHIVFDACLNTNSCIQRITVALPGCEAPQPRMLGIQFVPAGVHLTFKGLPGRPYQILRAAELNKPWTLVGTATTGANGAGEFIDTNGGQSEYRMYKLLAPSNP